MTEVFIKVLNMSITASYVALAVMLVRLLFKKAPKIFSYILWSVVLFRLICPFSFESVYSLIPDNTNIVQQNIVDVQNPSINSGVGTIDNAVNSTIQNSLPPVERGASYNPMDLVIWAASNLWILGVILLLSYGIFTYLRLKKRLLTATLVQDNIYETDCIKTPFVLGFVHPKIYIPVGIEKEELDYILKHEKTHIKRRDHLIKPFAFIALAIHWFNPIIWVSFVLMVKDMEMSCDESVIRQSKEDIRGSYSESLLSMSIKQSGLISPLAFGENNTMGRIKNILKYKRPAFWVVFIAVVAVFCVGVSLMTNPKSTELTENNYVKEIYKYRTEYIGDNVKVVSIVDRLNMPETLKRANVQLYTNETPYMVEVTYETTSSVREYYSGAANQTIFDQNAILVFALVGNVEYVNFVLDDGKHDELIQRTRDWANDNMGQDVWKGSGDIEKFNVLYDDIMNSRQVIDIVENNIKIIMSSPKESSSPKDYIKAHQNEYEDIIKHGGEEALNYMLFQFKQGNAEGLRGHIMMDLCKELLGQRNNVTDETLSPQDWFAKLNIRKEINLPDFSYVGANPIERLVYQTGIEKSKTHREGFTIVAPHIFGSYEEENKLKVFVTTFSSHYRLYDKVLSHEGGAIIPVAITYEKSSDGSYTLYEYKRAKDGSDFSSSIKEFCKMPVSHKNIRGLADKILNHYGNYDDIIQLERENLIKHLKANNQYGVSLYQEHFKKPAELIPLT